MIHVRHLDTVVPCLSDSVRLREHGSMEEGHAMMIMMGTVGLSPIIIHS